MTATFKRKSLNQYETFILRNDGVELRVPAYDRTFRIPHDIAHFVVESELHLRRGVWGTIAAGGVFAGMVVLRGRQRPHAAEHSKRLRKQNHPQIIEAEVLVGEFMKLVEGEIAPRSSRAIAIIDRRWKPAHPDAGEIRTAQIVRTCAELQRAGVLWHSLQVGESFSRAWPLITSRPQPN